MSKGAINFNYDNDYFTPKKIIDYFADRLHRPIEYDPATTPELAAYHGIPNFTALPDNGLDANWTVYGCVWINPPFTQKQEFWDKAVASYRARASVFLFLCPISFLTTKAFTKWQQPIELYIPQGRIKFERAPGEQVAKSPAFGSVIVRPADDTQIFYLPKGLTDD